MAESYDRFAPHFDAWQRAFGEAYDHLVLPRILEALACHPAPMRRVADLGMGTGDMVVALARAGYTVVGVDRSVSMLEVARAKIAAEIAAGGLSVTPELARQDLRALRLDEPVDAAICVYTVINQLTGDGDLERAMRAVHDALVPGGLFLFELNLPEAYERYWTGEESVAIADGVVTRRHRRSGALVEAHVTIHRRDGSAVHDHIAQRLHTAAEVDSAAAAAGFRGVDVEPFNPFDPSGPPVKALWSAQRARA